MTPPTREARAGLRWGFVGASAIALNSVAPAVHAQPGSRIAAVQSRSSERGEAFRHAVGAERVHTELADLLADPDVDAVYISTVNNHHAEQAVAAAEAGKHVLCEKPIGLSVADATRAVQAAEKAGVVFATNHHMRNSAPHEQMRSRIAAGQIGIPLSAAVRHVVLLPESARGWRTEDSAAGAGVALDILVHDADTLRYVLNADPESVTAQTINQGVCAPGIDDDIQGVLRFPSLLAGFHEAFTTSYASTVLAVYGTEGALIGNGIQSMQPVGSLTLRTAGGDHEVDLGRREDLYVRALRRFTEAVREGTAPAASGEDGIWSVAVAVAALESASTGRTIGLDPLEEFDG